MNRLIIFTWFICCACLIGCGKQNDWLDKPKDPNDNILNELKDFQAVLNNTSIFNSSYPVIGQLGCDHYYFTDQFFNLVAPTERNAYRWSHDIFEGRSSVDYASGYLIINRANIVLDALKGMEVDPGEQLEFNNVKGQALFFRSIMFFELASLFCKPYNSQTASDDLGLSLKLTSSIYEIEKRASVEATYKQIIDDLSAAASLLPITSNFKTRPSRVAVYALLARVYLNMGNYEKGKQFSDSTLAYNNELLDFNSGTPSLLLEFRFPDFKTGNKEVIFYSEGIGYLGIVPDYNFGVGFVDTVLYRSYEEFDLRKRYFYEQQGVSQIRFRGTYTGASYNFAGLGINEIYLIRAECNARLSNIQASLNDLNSLLVTRYEQGKYTNYHTDNVNTLLAKILLERTKELPFTSQIRWQDLRRLNVDPRFAISITRIIGGEAITLEPNDPKYVYPIPQDEIDRTGIVQNER